MTTCLENKIIGVKVRPLAKDPQSSARIFRRPILNYLKRKFPVRLFYLKHLHIECRLFMMMMMVIIIIYTAQTQLYGYGHYWQVKGVFQGTVNDLSMICGYIIYISNTDTKTIPRGKVLYCVMTNNCVIWHTFLETLKYKKMCQFGTPNKFLFPLFTLFPTERRFLIYAVFRFQFFGNFQEAAR